MAGLSMLRSKASHADSTKSEKKSYKRGLRYHSKALSRRAQLSADGVWGGGPVYDADGDPTDHGDRVKNNKVNYRQESLWLESVIEVLAEQHALAEADSGGGWDAGYQKGLKKAGKQAAIQHAQYGAPRPTIGQRLKSFAVQKGAEFLHNKGYLPSKNIARGKLGSIYSQGQDALKHSKDVFGTKDMDHDTHRDAYQGLAKRHQAVIGQLQRAHQDAVKTKDADSQRWAQQAIDTHTQHAKWADRHAKFGPQASPAAQAPAKAAAPAPHAQATPQARPAAPAASATAAWSPATHALMARHQAIHGGARGGAPGAAPQVHSPAGPNPANLGLGLGAAPPGAAAGPQAQAPAQAARKQRKKIALPPAREAVDYFDTVLAETS